MKKVIEKLMKYFFILFLLCFSGNVIAEVHDVGKISGVVTDKETGEPVDFVAVLIVELNQTSPTRPDGSFLFTEIPIGTYTIKVYRVGYHSDSKTIKVTPHEAIILNFSIEKLYRSTQTINVESDRDSSEIKVVPDQVFSGKDLRQMLGKTIAETLSNEAGLSQRSMGPAPARPVARGLSGDRLLILEDGGRTGDLSATSADHALTIDPMTAERIEIIRGPEAIIYGSNTLGGVINVIREQIPLENYPHFHGSLSGQAESVNKGGSGGLSLTGPVGFLQTHLDGSYRKAGNMKTPTGTLENTGIETRNFSNGWNWHFGEGYVGASAGYFESFYGIPGGFVGGHKNGVDIEIRRRQYEIKGIYHLPWVWLTKLEFNTAHINYYHLELEKGGLSGAEFGLLTNTVSLNGFHQKLGFFDRGRFGVWFEKRDYASAKLTFTPNSFENTFSGHLFEEINWYPFTFQLSFRYDNKTVSPKNESVSKRIGNIRERNFQNVSGGFSAIYLITQNWTAGSNLIRSFKAPGIEELYSNGPHLAAYSFEIGNPDINEETGFGIEVFLKHLDEFGKTEFTLFRNQIQGFIFPVNTGRLNSKLPYLFDYQYAGVNALMTGAELTWDYVLPVNLRISGNVSYVQGELTDSKNPLPYMPPLSGKLKSQYQFDHSDFGFTVKAADKQNQLGEFEQATNGYIVYDLFAQIHFTNNDYLHTLDFTVENILNTEYRNHLSRVKSIVPEPGRNFKLLYKFFF
ncbi:MAG: TonB-dependent receptor [Bacteroidetes bacterium]|nr:TonB-dependent receptor [Bacteroidota bacterium]